MELIQFGSSINKNDFSDIDVAILLEDESRIDEISSYLLKNYPSSKVDIAPMYTAWESPPKGDYHFIIGTKETIKINERLSNGIDRGVVIKDNLGIRKL